MVDPTQFLDLYGILVNDLIGDFLLFIFVFLGIIFYFSAKNTVAFQPALILVLLFLSAVVSAVYTPIIWILVVMISSGIGYYVYATKIRRGY